MKILFTIAVLFPFIAHAQSGCVQPSCEGGPVTTLHYAPNANLPGPGNTFAPGVIGANLGDVGSAGAADVLPAGVLGLIFVDGTGGATPTFQAVVNAAIGDAKVWGFYIADVPPNNIASQLKAAADYVHTTIPTAKVFIVDQNQGPPNAPVYTYNTANTDIDYFGVDAYPIRMQFAGGADYTVIAAGVAAEQAIGIPISQLVPIYQAFGGGGYPSWTIPTPAQEVTILQTWGRILPTPVFDFAYSWGVQLSDDALVTQPALQAVIATHNSLCRVQSPNKTFISPGTGRLVDSTFNVYLIDGSLNAMENGVAMAGGSNTGQMQYDSGNIYGQDATSLLWYLWNGSAFTGPVTPP